MQFRSAATFAALVVTLVCTTAESARCQGTDWNETWVGSEWELYARALTLRGAIGGEPWSIRPFAPSVTRAWGASAGDHPWAARLAKSADTSKSFVLLRPSISSSYNSGFAWGMNDGPVWQGRGANAWVTGGFAFRSGPLSIRVEPLVDYGENQAFALEPTPSTASRFADDMRPFNIDLPQRMGEGSVRIIDPGQSYIRLDIHGVAAGFSTEDMFWGPGVRNAILFDGNAAGFPHAFLGTTHVVKTPIGGFSAQLVYGKLSESAWAPPASSTARFGAGAIAVFTPTPTIEVGAARFYHREWTGQFGTSEIAAPFGSFFNNTQTTESPDNQLLSFFASARIPSSGFEVFGEFGKNDRNSSLRDALLEPEHNSAWLVGFFDVIGPATLSDGFWTIRVEAGSGRVSPIQQIGRGQSTFYDHTFLTQGHTEDGQLLGSPLIDRSGGIDAALDRWTKLGRMGVSIMERQMPGDLQVGMPADQLRTQWDTGINTTRFVGRFDVSAAIGRVWDLNRFPGTDVGNNYARISLRANWM
jgi:hypothetical protein